MVANRRQRNQGRGKDVDYSTKDTVNELRGRLKKLEKENKRLRLEISKQKRTINKTDKMMNKHAKNIDVTKMVEELEEEMIVEGKIKDERCPICRSYYKESNLPFGILRVCENKDCDWREVIKD